MHKAGRYVSRLLKSANITLTLLSVSKAREELHSAAASDNVQQHDVTFLVCSQHLHYS